MRRAALSAIYLALFCSTVAHTQQNSLVPPSNRQTPTETPSALTPRQLAIMHADIQMAKKLFPEAISTYTKILREEPNNAELLNKIGVAYQQLGDLGRSNHFYKAAVKVAVKGDRTYCSALNNLGTVEYAKKRYGKAIHYYKQVIALQQDLATTFSNLGYAYFADKQYAPAMESFQKALALDAQIFEHHGSGGMFVQQRAMTDPGLFYFLVAKSYALAGDAPRCAHFLKMARDEGYKDYLSAQKDSGFSRVINDPLVQDVLAHAPPFQGATNRALEQ